MKGVRAGNVYDIWCIAYVLVVRKVLAVNIFMTEYSVMRSVQQGTV